MTVLFSPPNGRKYTNTRNATYDHTHTVCTDIWTANPHTAVALKTQEKEDQEPALLVRWKIFNNLIADCCNVSF